MTTTPLAEPRVLLTGRSMLESGRWHDGRLFFADWGTGEVVSLDPADPDGSVVTTPAGPPPGRMGWSVDWLPDGRMITTGDVVTVHEPDGSTSVFSEHGCGETAVHPAGHVFVNGFEFDFRGGGKPEPGWIRLLDADGGYREVAGDVQFPNGMVVTPDGRSLVVAESFASRLTAFDVADDGSLTNRRVWADGLAPDGLSIDAEGGLWAQTSDTAAHGGGPSAPNGAAVRVLEGGEITHRVETGQPIFATALSPAGQLFCLCNDFVSVEKMGELLERRSARVLVTDAPHPA